LALGSAKNLYFLHIFWKLLDFVGGAEPIRMELTFTASNNKRSWPGSGVSVDKRQRLSGDDSEILELEESEALIEQVDGDDTKCRTGCIYLITNPFNGKVYVGKTIHYKKRMSRHKYSGKNPKHYFSNAIRKYGWENFTKEILIDEVPEEDLDNLEINYIAFYDSSNREKGYNGTKGGEGASGYKYTKEQCMAHSKRNTKNHNVEGGGSVSKYLRSNMWRVYGFQSLGEHKYIGQYLTEEKACQALKLYNETGERMPSDVTRRKNGTGCIRKLKNGRVEAAYQDIRIGTFSSEEEAELAIKKRKKDISNGEVFTIKTRKHGTGSISKNKYGKFNAYYKGKYVGSFASEDEAEQAIKIHRENLNK
jgi:group I intron endonuclease